MKYNYSNFEKAGMIFFGVLMFIFGGIVPVIIWSLIVIIIPLSVEKLREKKGLVPKSPGFYDAKSGKPLTESQWAKKMDELHDILDIPKTNNLDGNKEGNEDVKISYYDNGKKKEEKHFKDENIELMTGWYENGQKKGEINFKDGEVDGLFREWHDNGQKKGESFFKNGHKISSKKWNVDGVPYIDGKLKGVGTTWYDNGQKKSEKTYKSGEKDGLWTTWYDNGKKKSESTYKDGKKDGLWIEYYENGEKEEELTYKDEKIDGLYTRWYENGEKMYEGTFKNGDLISEKCWDEDGNEKDCN